MQKLGEYLREMGEFTQKTIDRRALQGATGYETIEMAAGTSSNLTMNHFIDYSINSFIIPSICQ